MKFILGRKIGMTQLFDEQERVQPVTIVQAGPCVVTQIKSIEKDAYQAVQVGFDEKAAKEAGEKKQIPLQKKFRVLKEFMANKKGEQLSVSLGDTLSVEQFQVHDMIDVRGVTKGKGFQGVVKRHDFGGGPRTHGHRHELRKPGSTGRRFPQHTVKGQRMAGRMGGEHVVTKNLEILWIDTQKNLLAIKGAFAGPNNSIVEISTAKNS